MRRIFWFCWVLFYTQQVWKLLIQIQYDIGIFTIQHSCNTPVMAPPVQLPSLGRAPACKWSSKDSDITALFCRTAKELLLVRQECRKGCYEAKSCKSAQLWGSQEVLLYTVYILRKFSLLFNLFFHLALYMCKLYKRHILVSHSRLQHKSNSLILHC